MPYQRHMHRQAPQPVSFMDYVQAHEREWGNDNYPGRPDLAAIMRSPVVVFWYDVAHDEFGEKPLLKITLHQGLDDVERYLCKIMFRANIKLPDKRIHKIFANGNRVIIKGVRVLFEEVVD